MIRDNVHELDFKVAVIPTALNNDDPIVGAIIDTRDCHAVSFAWFCNTLADTTVTITPLLEYDDDAAMATAVAVPDDYLLGTEAAAVHAATDDNKGKWLGYKGPKRYVRLTLTPATNTGTGILAGLAILSKNRKDPMTSQTFS